MDFYEALAENSRTPDEIEGRVYGFQVGRVVDVTDPEGLGRVRGQIMAMRKGEASDWLVPAWPGAMEGVPRVGDPLLVAFVDGDPHRGIYFWHPQSTTTGRPVEFMVLGTSLVGLMNQIVDLVNDVKQKYNNHTHFGSTPPKDVPGEEVTTADAAKGLDSRGAEVGAISSDTRALSGEAKVR